MWLNNNQLTIPNNEPNTRFNWVSDELTLNASDNDVAPESPIILGMECDWIIINIIIFNHKLNLRNNWVSDEFTFNAFDNDVAPDVPILLQMECYWIIINQSYSIINSILGTIEWVMN